MQAPCGYLHPWILCLAQYLFFIIFSEHAERQNEEQHTLQHSLLGLSFMSKGPVLVYRSLLFTFHSYLGVWYLNIRALGPTKNIYP